MRRALLAIGALLVLSGSSFDNARTGGAAKAQHGFDNARTGGAANLLVLPFTSNGALLTPTAQTDLWLVADDLTSGQNWSGHGGTAFSATVTGTPTVGVETPLYPAGGFAGSGYRKGLGACPIGNHYAVPANAAHVLDGSNAVTYEILYLSGDSSDFEYLISNGTTNAASSNFEVSYNGASGVISLAIFNTGGTSYWSSNSIGGAAGPRKLTLVTFVWTPGVSLSTYINGVLSGGGAAGTGSINTPSNPLWIGDLGRAPGNGIVHGAVLEVMRHAGLAMGATQVAQRFQAMAGVQDQRGTYPSAYTRTSDATTVVNGKLWRFGSGWPRIDLAGYYAEGAATNLLADSIFNQTFATYWSTSGGGITNPATDSERFSAVGGNQVDIACDSTPTEAHAVQVTGSSLSGTTAYTYSADWKSQQAGGILYAAVKNNTTTNFLQANGTWGVSVAWLPFGTSSTSRVRNSITFTTEGTASACNIYFGNGGNAANKSVTLSVFHVQLEANPAATSRIITAAATASRVTDLLQYPSSTYSNTKGSAALTFAPDWNSPSWGGSEASILYTSTNAGRMIYTNNAGHMRAFDSTNIAEIAATLSAGVARGYKTTWGGSSLTIADTTGGASNTVSFDGTLGVGGVLQVGAGSVAPNGHIKNLVIKSQ